MRFLIAVTIAMIVFVAVQSKPSRQKAVQASLPDVSSTGMLKLSDDPAEPGAEDLPSGELEEGQTLEGLLDKLRMNMTPEQLQQLKDADIRNSPLGSLTEAQKKELEELGITKESITVEVHSPIEQLRKKAEKNRNAVESLARKAAITKGFIKAQKKNIPYIAGLLLGLAFAAIVALWAFKSYSVLRLTASFLYGFSQFVFVLIICMSFWYLYMYRGNLWLHSGGAFFWFSAGVFVASNIGMRLDDENYPFLKSVGAGLIYPLIQATVLQVGLFFISH